MTNKFEHIGVSVSNLEKSIDWYKECLGFEEIRKFDKQDLELKGASLKLGDFSLELLQPYNPKPKDKYESLEVSVKNLLQKIGTTHLALIAHDFYDIYKKLSENNELHTEIIDDKFFFCVDYDGNLIEIKKG
jgi:catechol 2,3-dioxygenase-like lactoylglutathione lyase family enzyme